MNIKIAHINARSLTKNFDGVKGVLLTGEFDIVGVCETWLNSDITDDMIAVGGFNILRARSCYHKGKVKGRVK